MLQRTKLKYDAKLCYAYPMYYISTNWIVDFGQCPALFRQTVQYYSTSLNDQDRIVNREFDKVISRSAGLVLAMPTTSLGFLRLR